MAELTKVFMFSGAEGFKVVEIDEDTTQQPEQDAPIKVCTPKDEIKAELESANPGVFKFYIDGSDEDAVAIFESEYKAAE
jgi:hypothetical protein